MLNPGPDGARFEPQASLGSNAGPNGYGRPADPPPPAPPPPSIHQPPASSHAGGSQDLRRVPPPAVSDPLISDAEPHWKQAITGRKKTRTAGAESQPTRVKTPLEKAAELRGQSLPQQDEDLSERAIAVAPPWLVSLVFHMALLVVLGLLGLPMMLNEPLELNLFAEDLGEQLENDQLEMIQFDAMIPDSPVLALDELPVEDPLAAPPQLEIALPSANVMADDQITTPNIGLALTGRQQGRKEALLAAYGGTALTEEAVKLGLEWLKRNQQRDGTWSLKGPYLDGCPYENDVAATAMALLAFLGAGHTHQSGDYIPQVERGYKALLRMQDRDGNFFRRGPSHHRLYSQAQATIAICELYGMTGDSELRHPAQLAIDYAVKIQSPSGGWRYDPGQDTDTSVTGWFVMALQSAMMASLEVPRPTLYRVEEYLDSASRDGGVTYRYTPQERDPSVSMTAEALLCRQYLGWRREDERMQEGVQYLLRDPIDYSSQDVYYWYYATQTLHNMEGEAWDQWNRVMRRELPKEQVRAGGEAGSWNPGNDQWGTQAGRLYTTCLSIYMLEVYYRHLPIYSYRLP